MKYKVNIAIILSFAFFLIFPFNGYSQNKDFRKLTISEGLSHDNVYTIIQDAEGFMWIGTQNGLDKYDGNSFTSFFHDPKDSCSLVSANFGKLFQDSKGKIWLGTYRGGLSCYTPKENTIKHYSHIPNDSTSLSSNLVRNMAEDINGNIWITTSRGGLHLYNEKQNNFRRFVHNPNNRNSLASNNANAVAADKNGFVWVGTANGLSRINIKTFAITNFHHDKANPSSVGSSSIQSLFVDSKNGLWVGTRDAGAYKFIPADESFISLSKINSKTPSFLNKERIQCIYESSENRVWLGTYSSGIVVYNLNNDGIQLFKNDPNNSKGLSHNKIETIFEDSARNLWIGTRGGGINILDLKPQKFKNQMYEASKEEHLAGKNVTSFTNSIQQNKVWVGTNSGLSLWDTKKDGFQNFFHESGNKNSLAGNRVRTLLTAKDSILWVGTYNAGISRVEELEGKINFTNYNNKTGTNLPSNQINTLIQDTKGNIWVGTRVGLARIKFNEQNNPTFESFDDTNCELFQKFVIILFEDSKQNIWVGTPFGLYLFLPETTSFKLFINESNDTHDIDINNINHIFEDSKKRIWIGTGGGGLFLFNKETGSFLPYKDGSFKTGNIESILESDDGYLWLSTAKGLSSLNTENKEFTHFGISNGLAETGFSPNASIKLDNGNFVFGNISGFTIFNPSNIGYNPHKPTIALTDFKIFNNSYFKGKNSFCTSTPSQLKEITLTHDDYVFSFEFAALDFTFPSKNKYRYKMEGFDKDWIEFGTKHYAMFTSLPPGTYIFRAEGTNNDGLWSSEEQSLSIKVIIKPAFWQTKLFIFGIGTILLIILGVFIKLRLGKLEREKARLEVMVEQRTLDVERQKEVLEANSEEMKLQNEKIRSSIRYAKTIQQAILPFASRFDSFSDSFIIYKPKDIVSGDFYWYENIGGYRFIAAVDCSGHGVPGAFMSMIGSRLLKEIITEKGIFDPSEILSKLDQYVKLTLKQDQTDNRDGMDVCLIRLQETESGYDAVFSGAKRDLIYYKASEKKLCRQKGTRRSIGGVFSRKQNQDYVNITLNFVANDIIYLATDGFIDQNNPKRVRYGTQKLIPLLEKISELKTDEIKEQLLKSLSDFQETSKQRDDITVIGMRLK